jgi:hypothetical protein
MGRAYSLFVLHGFLQNPDQVVWGVLCAEWYIIVPQLRHCPTFGAEVRSIRYFLFSFLRRLMSEQPSQELPVGRPSVALHAKLSIVLEVSHCRYLEGTSTRRTGLISRHGKSIDQALTR